jgi:tRNA1(Val) A37 N6-methylase TrmN6
MSSPTIKKLKAQATTTDDFLGGRIAVIQPKAGHRAGSDAVFLAAAVPAREGMHVLDVGAGVGVAGLCLLARVPGCRRSRPTMPGGTASTINSTASLPM